MSSAMCVSHVTDSLSGRTELQALVRSPDHVQARSTTSTFSRAEAPALMATALLGHEKRLATSAMSSRLALPSTGGDFTLAIHTPSAPCSSDDTRALSRTFTRNVKEVTRQRPTCESRLSIRRGGSRRWLGS